MRNFQDDFDEKEQEELQKLHRKGCIAILIAALCLAFACAATSCKSVKTEVKYNYRDSIITHYLFDTIHITITDTIHVEASSENESESETEIQFGEGGGTWNAQTGEATNVASVKQSNKEKELQKLNVTYKHIADSASAKCDSLFAANRDLQEQINHQENTKDITPRSGWDRFCTWWTIGSWVVLLLLLVYACWRVYRKYWLHI